MSPNVVYTGGTFDLFHHGHVALLARCRTLAGLGGLVVVSLNTDDFVEEYKGRPPAIPYAGRYSVVAACRYVDRVICNIGGRDSKRAIQAVGPNIIAVGSDWETKDYYRQMSFTREWLAERHIRIVYLPYTQEISTSQIRAAL